MHNTSMGYPDILRQTPIFCMNTQKKHTKIGKKAEPCFYHLSISPPLELFPFYHYPHRTIRFFVKIFLADPPMILLPWQGRPRHIAKAPLAKQFLLLAVFQTFRQIVLHKLHYRIIAYKSHLVLSFYYGQPVGKIKMQNNFPYAAFVLWVKY
jgi:hypothetical protein